MIGTILRAMITLLSLAIYIVVFRLFGLDLVPLLTSVFNLVLGIILVGALSWYGFVLYEKGRAHAPRKWQYWRGNVLQHLIQLVLLAAAIGGSIAGLAGAIAVPVALALIAINVAPHLAQRGIREWEREQRGESTSGIHGKARFVVFDADLDRASFSKLENPPGTGALLGFYHANLLPSFFHRLTAWLGNRREAWREGFSSHGIVTSFIAAKATS
jgi:hypothetical protein